RRLGALRRVPAHRRDLERRSGAGVAHAARPARRRPGGTGAVGHAGDGTAACRGAGADQGTRRQPQRRVQGAADLGRAPGQLPARAAAPPAVALGSLRRRTRARGPHRQGPRRARSRSRGCLGAARAPAGGRGQSARRGPAGRLIAMHALHVLYGGTFDPVHAGHLAIARAAREALGVPVHLMPAADPPHRPPPGATAAQRVAMLELALEAEPGLRLDLRELARSGRSWSVDTLRGLRANINNITPVTLLVSTDSFADLPTWKAWRELFGLTHFVVASRDGDDGLPPELEAALQGRMARTPDELSQSPAGKVLWLRQPLHPQSATAIRARIAAGEPWRHLVPAPVARYI